MQYPVLVVDDEPDLREVLSRRLEKAGCTCLAASGVDEALDVFRKNPDIGIILTDLKMPKKSGLDLIAEVKAENNRDVEFIVMTGYAGIDEAIEALRLGAHDFLKKPVGFDHLRQVIQRADELLCLRSGQRVFHERMEITIREKTAEAEALVSEVENSQLDALQTLAVAAEFRDNDTGTHIRRIGAYAMVLAEKLGWAAARQGLLGHAATLHDTGKIGVPDSILFKPGALTENEASVMRRHTLIGHEILSKSSGDILKMSAQIALAHHERWDGSGYPSGLRGTEIPPEAHLTSICDVYDALRSKRPYKGPASHDEVVSIILDGDGRTSPDHFDPILLRFFAQHSDDFDRIYKSYME
jgi:putative two-component system response regulator